TRGGGGGQLTRKRDTKQVGAYALHKESRVFMCYVLYEKNNEILNFGILPTHTTVSTHTTKKERSSLAHTICIIKPEYGSSNLGALYSASNSP
ncbi:hypothetical protein ACJX0J_026480, partial [Zea mays]